MVAEPMGRVTTMKRIMNTESAKAERRAKQRKGAWTAARRKKFSATMAAKRANRVPDRVDEIAALRAAGNSMRAIAKQLKMSEGRVRSRLDWIAENRPKSTAAQTMMFPAEAIPPRRSAPMSARTPRRVVSSAPQRAMRVVVKAGSEITVTIGGVEVQIVAEER